MKIAAYFSNLWDAIRGREMVCTDAENFDGPGSGMPLIFFIFSFAIFFTSMYGAASLSWHYNVHMGNKDVANLWSILCFFFSGWYYPYYALALNPLLQENMAGGKKK